MATEAQKKAFINLIAPSVQNQCKKHGWGVPSAIIAQAGIESAWGTSSLGSITSANSCYNFWGMKWKEGCGTDYKEFKTSEQKADGTYYQISAKFRKWNSVEEGIDGYFKFIESYSRYKPVMATTTYKDYAIQIKNCGWATSLQYTNNIIKTVESNKLTVYDTSTTSKTTSSTSSYYPQYKGSTSSLVVALQVVGETDTSISRRKKIAIANGISNYIGSASQNLSLIEKLKSGVCIKP